MRGSLRRRLERLIECDPSTAGRMIVLAIEAERVDDGELVQATLAGTGIERAANDLTILIKRYSPHEAGPACSLLAVSPLTSNARRAQR